MRYIYVLIFFVAAGGCSHWTQGREVVCEVTCENCEKVTHTCNGTTTEQISEVKN